MYGSKDAKSKDVSSITTLLEALGQANYTLLTAISLLSLLMSEIEITALQISNSHNLTNSVLRGNFFQIIILVDYRIQTLFFNTIQSQFFNSFLNFSIHTIASFICIIQATLIDLSRSIGRSVIRIISVPISVAAISIPIGISRLYIV